MIAIRGSLTRMSPDTREKFKEALRCGDQFA